jgi:hypothetical protein
MMPSLVEMAQSLDQGLVDKSFATFRAGRSGARQTRKYLRATRKGEKLARYSQPTIDNVRSVVREASRSKVEAANEIGNTVVRSSKKAAAHMGVGIAGGLSAPVAVNQGLGAWRDRASDRRHEKRR